MCNVLSVLFQVFMRLFFWLWKQLLNFSMRVKNCRSLLSSDWLFGAVEKELGAVRTGGKKLSVVEECVVDV